MYKIVLQNIENKYDFNELTKIFISEGEYELYTDFEFAQIETAKGDANAYANEDNSIIITAGGFSKNQVKQELYKKLSQITGKTPKWGIHTGVRPIKLVCELFDKYNGSEELVRDELSRIYLFSDEKLNLAVNIARLQRQILKPAPQNSVGLYIGIPFCPTRCLYCSFTSNELRTEKVEEYLSALFLEIEHTKLKMNELSLYPESIYIGGGTPTTLSAEQLDRLLTKIEESYDLSKLVEFTVEAGRADTITRGKLEVLKNHNIKRISINPQSMKDETLALIGRNHTGKQVEDAFELAHSVGGFSINADVIAGLPQEKLIDFENTLTKLVSLNADNITVHTLAVKKGSKLVDIDSAYHIKRENVANDMVKLGYSVLKHMGYEPYYLYRQKYMAGALENTGYAKSGKESVYNIRIMDEHQTIVALGAGGISKAYFPAENRLMRVPNVSNYEIYISRIQDMLDRKTENLFTGGLLC